MYHGKPNDRMSYLKLYPEVKATLNKDVRISFAQQTQELLLTSHTFSLGIQHCEGDYHSRQKRVIPNLIGLAAAEMIGTMIGFYFRSYSQSQCNALPLLKDMNLLLHVDNEHHFFKAVKTNR